MERYFLDNIDLNALVQIDDEKTLIMIVIFGNLAYLKLLVHFFTPLIV